jgi:hypothetical protein
MELILTFVTMYDPPSIGEVYLWEPRNLQCFHEIGFCTGIYCHTLHMFEAESEHGMLWGFSPPLIPQKKKHLMPSEAPATRKH